MKLVSRIQCEVKAFSNKLEEVKREIDKTFVS